MLIEPVKIKHDWKSFAIGMLVLAVVQILAFFYFERNLMILFVGVLALPVLYLFSIVIVKFIDIATPVIIVPGGVRCYTVMGMKTNVSWKDVESTKYLTFWPGLRWILLDDGRKGLKKACIPIFLQDKEALYLAVVNSAGENHVVAKALRENGFGST